MNPWAQAVFDTLGAIVSREVVEEVLDRDLLEVLPLTHIRGRSLHDAFVIVDEAQSLERNVLLTVLSRIGQSSRVVLTHDVAQRDNLRVGRHDGVAAVIEALKGHPLFAHVTLTRSERSPVAALVTEMLESIDGVRARRPRVGAARPGRIDGVETAPMTVAAPVRRHHRGGPARRRAGSSGPASPARSAPGSPRWTSRRAEPVVAALRSAVDAGTVRVPAARRRPRRSPRRRPTGSAPRTAGTSTRRPGAPGRRRAHRVRRSRSSTSPRPGRRSCSRRRRTCRSSPCRACSADGWSRSRWLDGDDGWTLDLDAIGARARAGGRARGAGQPAQPDRAGARARRAARARGGRRPPRRPGARRRDPRPLVHPGAVHVPYASRCPRPPPRTA